MNNKKTFSVAMAFLAAVLLAMPSFAQTADPHDTETQNNTPAPIINVMVGTLALHPSAVLNLGLEAGRAAAMAVNAETSKANETYLDVSLLTAAITEDIIDFHEEQLEELTNITSKTLKAGRISAQDQYDLISLCIANDHLDILEALLKAGFDTTISEELNKGRTKFVTLFAVTLSHKNQKAYELLYAYTPENKRADILNQTIIDAFEVNNILR